MTEQELQAIQQQMHQVQQQLQRLDQQAEELMMVQEAVEEAKTIEEGSEAFVPISNGIFMRATLHKPEKLLVNVGADTAVTKSIDETKELVREQIEELGQLRDQMVQQMQQLQQHGQRLQKQDV